MARLTDKLSAVELTGLARPLADTDVTCTTGPSRSREWKTVGLSPFWARPPKKTKKNKIQTFSDLKGRIMVMFESPSRFSLHQITKLLC